MSAPAEAESNPERHPFHEAFDNAGYIFTGNVSDWMFETVEVHPPVTDTQGCTLFDTSAEPRKVTYAIPKIHRIGEDLYNIENGSAVSLEAKLNGARLGSQVIVHAGAEVENSHVGKGSTVGENARIYNKSTIDEGVRVGRAVTINKSHVELGVVIDPRVHLGEAVIGQEVTIGEETSITNSHVGEKSTVDMKTGIHGSDIADRVTIGKRVSVEGSQIGRWTTIGDKVKVEGAHVGAEVIALGNTRLSGLVPSRSIVVPKDRPRIVRGDKVHDLNNPLVKIASKKTN